MITPILRVRDVDLSLALYTRVFGFQGEGGLPGPDGLTVYAEAYLGEARLMLVRGEAPVSSADLYINLPESLDLCALYARLRAYEVPILEDLHEELWGDLAFTIRDLDGHRLTFAQAVVRPVYAALPVKHIA